MSIAIASLIVYIILLNPTLYSLIHHGRKGIMGWYLLTIFCILRIVGAVLQMRVDSTGKGRTAALIISSIGLSPLLLAAEGILHEA
jgi:hypothetical protein